ncbi:MAG: hypothetical protein GY708_14890 [Actinomycetia bacterium]|nr:hypothetical protein [Actinomycetes bacterium]
MSRHRIDFVLGLGFLLALLAACSGSVEFSIGGDSPEEAATKVIEGDLADQLGLSLAADCPDVEDPVDGDAFTCTATTEDGSIVHFDATIDEAAQEVSVVSTNTLEASELERAIAEVTNDDLGSALTPGDIECGEGSVIVAVDDSVVECQIADPATGEHFALAAEVDLSEDRVVDIETDYTPPFLADLIAVEMIQSTIAEQIGISLTAECPQVVNPAEGEEFACDATTEDGSVVHFNVTIDGEAEEVNVMSTNVLAPDDLEGFESSAEQALGEQVGVQLPDGSFECGDGPTIVPDSGDLDCTLTDPSNGDVYDAVLTVDLSDGSFDIEVADDPR